MIVTRDIAVAALKAFYNGHSKFAPSEIADMTRALGAVRPLLVAEEKKKIAALEMEVEGLKQEIDAVEPWD